MKILVADDAPEILFLLSHYLSGQGHEVASADDGAKALDAYRTTRPDLVILDVMMPYHNGFELLANLRSRPEWSAVPVLMLTSMGREEDVVRGLDCGASDYMIKPFRPAELVARVRKVLG